MYTHYTHAGQLKTLILLHYDYNLHDELMKRAHNCKILFIL